LSDWVKTCYNGTMKANALPQDIALLLWSYDTHKLDLEKDKQRIVINLVNYGDLKHWRWLVKVYSAQAVRRVIETTPVSEFRPQALKLISLLLGISQHNYACRGTY